MSFLLNASELAVPQEQSVRPFLGTKISGKSLPPKWGKVRMGERQSLRSINYASNIYPIPKETNDAQQ